MNERAPGQFPPMHGGVALALIVTLAAALRLYGLEIQSLWNDELSSLYRSQGQNISGMFRNVKSDVHPPLYHLIVWLVSNYVSDNAFYLRLPSAVFGILAVYRVYFLAREARDHRAGLFAAATLAVSSTAVYYSQEGRSNSLVLLLTVLSTHAAIHMAAVIARGEHPTARNAAGLCAWSILLIYSHYFGILTVAAQACALLAICLARSPGRLRSLLYCYLTIAASYLPWLPTMMSQLARGPVWITEPDLDAIIRFLELVTKGVELQIFLAAVALIVIAAGALKSARSPRPKMFDGFEPVIVLASVLIVTPALAVLVSYLVVPVFNDRNLIGVVPVACAIVGIALSRGLEFLGSRFDQQRLFGAGALVCLIVVSLYVVIVHDRYYATPKKEQFREAVNRLVQESRSEANPRAAFCAHNVRYLTYYSSRADWRGSFGPRLCTPADFDRFDSSVANAPGKRFFIWAHLRPDPLLMGELQRRYAMTLLARYLKAEIYSMERRSLR